MKKLLSLFMCLGLCLGLVGCGSDAETSKSDNSEKKEKKKEEKKEYAIGETVNVKTDDGEYNITITGVTETADRNEFSDVEAQRVIIISYTYENISYEDDLYISEMNIKAYDKGNTKLETYPASITYPDSISTGRNASASMAYALNNAENYIELEYYDNMFNSKADCKFILQW